MLNDRLLQYVNIDLHEVKVLRIAHSCIYDRDCIIDNPREIPGDQVFTEMQSEFL